MRFNVLLLCHRTMFSSRSLLTVCVLVALPFALVVWGPSVCQPHHSYAIVCVVVFFVFQMNLCWTVCVCVRAVHKYVWLKFPYASRQTRFQLYYTYVLFLCYVALILWALHCVSLSPLFVAFSLNPIIPFDILPFLSLTLKPLLAFQTVWFSLLLHHMCSVFWFFAWCMKYDCWLLREYVCIHNTHI